MAFAPSPYSIGGALNFGRAGSDYQSAYQNALNINSQNYNNILAGYQGLTTSVLGNIQGAGRAAEQDVTDKYAWMTGQQRQGLISRGLGNTTVANSVLRGLGYDQQKAYTDAANKFAGTYAGYQSQLGENQLRWMNSVSAPYPDPRAYIRNSYPDLSQSRQVNPMGTGGGFTSSGSSGTPYSGGVPQRPSGNYGGGAYSYTPPIPVRGSGAQNFDIEDEDQFDNEFWNAEATEQWNYGSGPGSMQYEIDNLYADQGIGLPADVNMAYGVLADEYSPSYADVGIDTGYGGYDYGYDYEY